MDTLIAKLVATPVLIGAASLAGRSWGETISGWFIGLPLTSGPICLFLALEQGSGFAAAEAGFCLAYGIVARRRAWPAAIAAGTLAFAAAMPLQLIALPLWLLVLVIYLALGGALQLMPQLAVGRAILPAPPRWDLAARMIVATGLVLALTALAPLVGARLSGLLATYPLFAAILAAFAHHQSGAAAAGRVLRGLLIGLFGFAGFFLVLTLAMEKIGIAAAFIAATVVAVAIQGGSLSAMRRAAFMPPRR